MQGFVPPTTIETISLFPFLPVFPWPGFDKTPELFFIFRLKELLAQQIFEIGWVGCNTQPFYGRRQVAHLGNFLLQCHSPHQITNPGFHG
jgi:hypothetical protein